MLTSADDLEIYIDVAASYSSVEVEYTLDGTTWERAGMNLLPQARFDRWEVNLGRFAPGSTIQYAIVATDAVGIRHRLNHEANGDYTAHVHSDFDNLTGPSPRVTSSGSKDGLDPWMAFDGDPFTRWESEPYVSPAWISYAFDGPVYIDQYEIDSTTASPSPRAWEFQGFDEELGWVTLDVRSGYTRTSVWNMKQAFTVAAPGAYSSYRLWITEDNLDNPSIVGIYSITIHELVLEVIDFDIYQQPASGAFTSSDDLWIQLDIEGMYTSAEVLYTADGVNWDTASMSLTQLPRFAHWEANLGTFPAGTVISYQVIVTDAAGDERLLNDYGLDYTAVVSETGSTLNGTKIRPV